MENKELKQPLVQVKNLCKYFQLNRKATLKAVDDVSFDIYKGETVSLVGESGCGKSTTGRCMIRLYDLTSGQVLYDGKDISKLNKTEQKEFCKKVQMIFQNPYSSLNPKMKIGQILREPLEINTKLNRTEIDKIVEDKLAKVGLDKSTLELYPHEFSGGQRQRIGIARALSVDPEFIICDEPISALDVSIQAQVINMLKNLQETMGLTYLFIAHDLSVVKYISDRVVVMYLGTIVETAETEELYSNPTHPYTKALLSAIPEADPKKAKANERIPIKGEIPSPINPKNCCRFAERCQYATERCFNEMPQLHEIKPGHKVACHLTENM